MVAQVDRVSMQVEVTERDRQHACVRCASLLPYCPLCGNLDAYQSALDFDSALRAAARVPFDLSVTVSASQLSGGGGTGPLLAALLDPLASSMTHVNVVLDDVQAESAVTIGSGGVLSVTTEGFEAGGSSSGPLGGASSTTVTVANCDISDVISAAGGGGAIAMHVASTGNVSLTVQDSTFSSCEAALNGGAVSFAAFGATGNVLVKRSIMVKNTAHGFGGGVSVWAGHSAAIVHASVEVSEFVGNTATHGGAMVLEASGGATLSGATTASVFASNTSPSGGGGALYLLSCAGVFHNSSFSRNYGGPAGGDVLIKNSVGAAFSQCTFVQSSAALAGSLQASASSVALRDVVMAETSAFTAGALHVDQGSTVSIVGCVYDRCTANTGACVVWSDSVVAVESTSFTEGRAAIEGAIVVDDGAQVTMVEVNITRNTAVSGAPIIVRGASSLHFQRDVIITDNQLASADPTRPGAAGGVACFASTVLVGTSVHFARNEPYLFSCSSCEVFRPERRDSLQLGRSVCSRNAPVVVTTRAVGSQFPTQGGGAAVVAGRGWGGGLRLDRSIADDTRPSVVVTVAGAVSPGTTVDETGLDEFDASFVVRQGSCACWWSALC